MKRSERGSQPGGPARQHLSLVTWSVASLGGTLPRPLKDAILRVATAKARDFATQGISNLVWGLATLGIDAGPALSRAMQVTARPCARARLCCCIFCDGC
jgi:hypothetical protein